MDLVPPHPASQPTGRRPARSLVLVLAIAGLALGTATVLARPAAAPGTRPATAPVTLSPGMTPHEANAGLDVGPGEAESELARLPDVSR